MKKLIILIAFTLVAFTANAQTYHYDVNNDGMVSITDVTYLVNNILGTANAGEGEHCYIYDVNGDGSVNVTDVTCLVNKILGVLNPGELPSNLTCPDDHHPHMIDLGLPSGTLWSCCNVGADMPEAYGGYYAWGETEEKEAYNWSTYEWCEGSYTTMTKYCASSYYGTVDGKTLLDPEDDVAHVKWGGDWCMPTVEQIHELLDNTTSEWTELNDVYGRKLTSKTNGNTIFLPSAGDRYDTRLRDEGSYGRYWSRSLTTSMSDCASHLFLSSGNVQQSNVSRQSGQSVRPVACASLAVSIETLSLVVGRTSTVDITSGSGSYSVKSSDANVAAASLSGTTITVTGVGEGTATITVKDTKTGQTATIVVVVHNYVDLGLPSGTLWASCNVGATEPWEYGGYYAWGETEEKDYYDWSTYKWCNGSNTTMTKYCTNPDYGTVDGKTELDPEDDVAHVKWGGCWRMPTREEQDELFNECTYEWTTLNGVNGKKFTGPNGNSIFLPAAGYYWDDSLHNGGNSGYYWSSTQDPSVSHDACRLLFRSGDAYWISYINRFYGLTVRPVASLTLSTTSLRLDPDAVETVEVTLGSGSYSVACSDETVATAAVDGAKITVTARGLGHAVITVTDTLTGLTATIEVSVVGCPDFNHPHLIDLGLPSGTKWACCNVGSDKPEAYGGYYAWGETEEKLPYSEETYQYYQIGRGYVNLGSDIAGTGYDVAHVKWGGSWVMPSLDQFKELLDNCTTQWTTRNGVEGRTFTGPNGGTIFLPEASCYWGYLWIEVGCCYWSSTQDPSKSGRAYYLYSVTGFTRLYTDPREHGQSVRPVSR